MRNPLLPHTLRRHRWDPRQGFPAPPVPPGPAVVHVTVRWLGDVRYSWTFDQPFQDPGPGGWSPGDLAGLVVDGITPDSIDEIIGEDGTLTLIYSLDHADTFHVVETPAVLRFANGATILLPDSGPVGS